MGLAIGGVLAKGAGGGLDGGGDLAGGGGLCCSADGGLGVSWGVWGGGLLLLWDGTGAWGGLGAGAGRGASGAGCARWCCSWAHTFSVWGLRAAWEGG